MLDLSRTSGLQTLVCMKDFFREDRLLVSKSIAAARSVGGALLESTCKLIDPGVGNGGSSTMSRLVWSVAWASLLLLLVVVVVDLGFLVVVSVVFLGGMTGSERVSRK